MRSRDLTVGSVPKHLIIFAVPMLIGNLLQASYALVNTFWVGNFIGPDAVGATTVTSPMQFMMIAIANGATLATSIMVAQYFGAKKPEEMQKVIGNSFSLAMIIGLILTAVGLIFGDNLLGALGVSTEQFGMASSYFRLLMIAFIPQFFGLLITAILRGIGDTITPLIFMAIGLGINAALDPLLIVGFGPFPRLGTNGAAIATIISQVAGLTIAMVYLNRKNHVVALRFNKFILDKVTTLKIIKIGFPSMLQQSVVSIGSAVVFSLVNFYGPDATNAFGGSGRLEMFIFLPALSFGMAASALTGQNIGANKLERVKSIYKWAAIFTFSITAVLSTIFFIFAKPILEILGFGKDLSSLALGIDYIHIVAPSYIFFALMQVSNGVINGSGKTFVTMMFSFFAIIVLRVPLALIFSRVLNLGINGIWLSIGVAFGTIAMASFIYYKSGRWKKGRLIEPSQNSNKVSAITE